MHVTHVLDLDTARALTANSRGRWPTQKAARQVRADCRALFAPGLKPVPTPVVVDVTLAQRTARRRDPDNVAGICKPILDEIVACGGLPDDSHRHVASVTYRVVVDPSVTKGTVRLDVSVLPLRPDLDEVAA